VHFGRRSFALERSTCPHVQQHRHRHNRLSQISVRAASRYISLMQPLSCLSMNVCPGPILQRILRTSTVLPNQTLRTGDDWVGEAGDASADTSIVLPLYYGKTPLISQMGDAAVPRAQTDPPFRPPNRFHVASACPSFPPPTAKRH
jgi:hypothetical protein